MFTLKKHTETQIKEKLDGYILSHPENSRVFEITPGIATTILDPEEGYYGVNRRRKQKKIADYSGEMTAGNWGLTGDTIKFGRTGFLIDGQHRLSACVRSGKSFMTHIVFGIDDKLFTRLDQGAARSAADVFKIADIPNAGAVAGACRWISILTGPDPKTDRATRLPENTLSLYQQPGVGERLQVGLPLAKLVGGTYGHPVPLLLAIWWLTDQRNSIKAAQFLNLWASGDGRKGSAMMKMQKELQAKKEASQGRVHDKVRAAMIIIAWNEFSAGRKGNAKLFNYDLRHDFPALNGMTA